MLADWNNNPRVDMSLHITRIPSRPVCSFSLMFRAKRETKNTNFIVFGLIQPGLELTRIHHTRAEHANHHHRPYKCHYFNMFVPLYFAPYQPATTMDNHNNTIFNYIWKL
jgi:hypothetical protein